MRIRKDNNLDAITIEEFESPEQVHTPDWGTDDDEDCLYFDFLSVHDEHIVQIFFIFFFLVLQTQYMKVLLNKTKNFCIS